MEDLQVGHHRGFGDLDVAQALPLALIFWFGPGDVNGVQFLWWNSGA